MEPHLPAHHGGLFDPAILFGHFSYFLLILSMMMRRMLWLRSIAIASGITKIIYRAFFVLDPVSVFWESVFVAVNVFQIVALWYFDNHYRRAVRRVLQFARAAQYEAGAALAVENAAVSDLIYITQGAVAIERGGAIVAACGPGDYIGELSFLTRNPATATAIASTPLRTLVFDQNRLRAAIEDDGEMRRVVEAALNHTLASKLLRSNNSQLSVAPQSA